MPQPELWMSEDNRGVGSLISQVGTRDGDHVTGVGGKLLHLLTQLGACIAPALKKIFKTSLNMREVGLVSYLLLLLLN